MGKIYEFPSNKLNNEHKSPAYLENKSMIENVIYALIESYKKRIEEIEASQKKLETINGTHVKNPKEMLKLVKEVNKQFDQYGILSNYHHFVTLEDTEVLYFNDTHLIYVYREEEKEKAKYFTVGEFIQEFEYYKFTLLLDETIYKALNEQITKLQITITTLENTQI